MTLVTAALNRIARLTSRDEPSSWVTGTDLEHKEIRDDFFMETIEDVLLRADWPEPIGATYDITGDGTQDYDLPSDYVRLDRDPWAVQEMTGLEKRLVPVGNRGEWERLKDRGASGAERYYFISGYPGNYTISIYPYPTTSISIKVSYQTGYWAVNAAGTTYRTTLTEAEDVLLLPRRLLETGTVARWRSRKGLDPMPFKAEYEALLSAAKTDAHPTRKIHMAPQPTARPWDIEPPDVIPSA